mmetsp:Transcript_83968/g.163216  ORF Transcript_83968/g.163216 Transcript_83968/m.163216 type:complete len:892 (-) Transcript_83968:12-2687(-)
MESPALFRFLRMRAGVGEAISSSTATITCTHVTTRWIAIGLSDGEMMLADHQGRIQARWRPHATPINAISADDRGEYIASSSDDGNVVVRKLLDYPEENMDTADGKGAEAPTACLETISFGEPLTCLYLDPYYGRKNEKMFVASGPKGNLILNKRNWFTSKDTMLHSGEGAVTSVAWKGNLVAWDNERGVKIVDVESGEKVTFVERPVGAGPKCHLLWETEESLLIGWAELVQILQIQAQAVSTSDMAPRRVAQITQQWGLESDCTLCGLTSFDEDAVAVLCSVREDISRGPSESLGEAGVAALPELHVRDRKTGKLLLIPDALPIQGYEHLAPTSYSLHTKGTVACRRNSHLSWNHNDWGSSSPPSSALPWPHLMRGDSPTMFVVVPTEVLVVKVRTLDDQITSALQDHRFRDALDIARKNEPALRKNRMPDLAQQFLEDLLHHEKFEEAARECPALFNQDAHAWEFWILRFMKCGQLECLIGHIPTSSPRLENAVYDLVLENLLVRNNSAFLKTIKLWSFQGRSESSGLFSLNSTMKRIQLHIVQHGPNADLVEAQAYLFTVARRFEDALSCFLQLDGLENNNSAALFALIEEHGLYAHVRNEIPKLVNLSKDLTGDLLVKAADEIPIEYVVRQLEDKPGLLLWYLHTLLTKKLESYNAPQHAALHARHAQLYADCGGDYGDPSSVDTSSVAADVAMMKPLVCESAMIRFLLWSRHANSSPDFLQGAYEACSQRNPPLWNEMVFILGETQQSQEALRLILTEIGDVHRAIQFIEKEKDSALAKDLWDDLIKFSLENKAFLTGMLDYAGLYSVELPSRLIREIPAKVDIPELRRKLICIIEEYRFQRSVHVSTALSMETRYHRERAQLYQTQRRGRRSLPSELRLRKESL